MARKRMPATNLVDLSGRLDGMRNYSDADVDAMIAAVGSLPAGDVVTTRWDDNAKKEIEVKVTRRAMLARSVELAAVTLAHEQRWQARPSPSAVKRDLRAIVTAANRLAALLKRHCGEHADDSEPQYVRFALKAQVEQWATVSNGYPGLFPDLVPVDFKFDAAETSTFRDYNPDAALQRCAKAVALVATAAEQGEARERHRIHHRREGKEARHVGDRALRAFIGDLFGIYLDVFNKMPGKSRPASGGDASGPFIRFVQSALKPLGIVKSGESIAAHIPGRRRRRRMVKSKPKES